ncbi:amino acid adenylation domain-containing protein [Streptomyces sp. NBC_00878]|uniref:amino acid adenylation domain-containing protein n=1 Tax=Streptomyces sp. NBC_00878 TaxID=2975854 RepID=UPI0022588F6C|nr:amino acid adenylation domain-containing protein [Streptomyces sp. NBC_00878]MCX4911609.1 amino acid adenylation domain-containing protein [Streptomyces sp. NBC_00878]
MTQTMNESDIALIRLPRALTEEQAARPAFVGARTVTYGELAADVAAVASGLLGLGAAVGDRVAIWMDKQPRYAETILAALQAGCAYVPLDGGQPPGRVATILTDSEPVVLFTDRRHLDALAGGLPASIRTIVLADETDSPNTDSPNTGSQGTSRQGTSRQELSGAVAGPDGRPIPVRSWTDFAAGAAGHVVILPALERDDLAAILYTSGSTGTPKGVRISYRNLANFIRWARAELFVGPDDVFANHASFNFDLSTFDLFTALSVGAGLWIVPDDQARDVTALAHGIREHGVTVWYSVPSVLNLLTASGALTAETVRSLRYVLFAGEVFPIPQLRALAARLPHGTELYNLYGPTETNVCTYHHVRPEDLVRDEPVPIGTPVPGARVSVVDGEGHPVEGPDAIGELIVEGDCVTPGYWRRESEPAAAGHWKGRHATGDLVSHEQGSLVYRGRKDRMVKLSGYRVELGEIEAAVLRHPAIAAAAVVVDGPGTDPRIALHYTLNDGARRPNLIEIKRHCAQHLPRYMLPRTATCLEELPRNANGKTDYHRLGGGTAEPAQRPQALPGK